MFSRGYFCCKNMLAYKLALFYFIHYDQAIVTDNNYDKPSPTGHKCKSPKRDLGHHNFVGIGGLKVIYLIQK